MCQDEPVQTYRSWSRHCSLEEIGTYLKIIQVSGHYSSIGSGSHVATMKHARESSVKACRRGTNKRDRSLASSIVQAHAETEQATSPQLGPDRRGVDMSSRKQKQALLQPKHAETEALLPSGQHITAAGVESPLIVADVAAGIKYNSTLLRNGHK